VLASRFSQVVWPLKVNLSIFLLKSKQARDWLPEFALWTLNNDGIGCFFNRDRHVSGDFDWLNSDS
jgi:hypothetical protein